MMATEPTSGNIDTRSPLSNNELINSSEELSKSCKNITEEATPKDEDSKYDQDFQENKINSVAGSICGGSDSDNFKVETLKVEGVEKGHLRNTSTVKKQTTFKPVSVNKKFLAAKGSTSTSLSKLGDKSIAGSASAQALPLVGSNSARPRLVAKSGTSLHATPRTTNISNGTKNAGAPDASAVWNKNRPAPPPEPKRYSDEELKQRYGIHLARRLQSDDSGKQANWADIDDDDDDWAPNTMEWADGTKSTLPQVDELPTPSPTPPAPEPVERAIESTKSISPAPIKILASPTVKTITFSGRAGLVLKSSMEKPSTLSKPSAPPSVVKSPWAPLPPVEKIAPIITESTLQQSRQGRTGLKDNLNIVPQIPAKEIAADDFRRTWRDGPNTSRELYNAQSGRYEPANERRRGSLRNEARPHQPSVLQRSTQDSPAEPSPAFQTFRSGGQDSYARRRNSSIVSVGSEKVKRRLSRGDLSPAHELLATQKVSITAGSIEPSSPSISSPLLQSHQPNHQSQALQSGVQMTASYQSPKTKHGKIVAINSVQVDSEKQASTVVYEDPFEVQKKAMRLSRELAIARRREQEEKEAAEKQERIRIKLASMGPSPEKVKKEPLQQEKISPQPQKSLPSRQVPNEKDNVVPETIKSNLDAPESKEIVQLASSTESNSVVKQTSSEAKLNTDHISQNSSPQNQHHQSWNSNTNDRFKPWAPAPSQQSSSRNVWGPPTNDRTLGNGTFNPELSRLPEISSHPGPIGPLTSNRGTPQGQGRDYTRPAPIGPPNRRQTLSLTQDSTVRSAVANSGWSSLPGKIAEEDARLAQRQDIEMTRIRTLREKGLLTEPPPPVVHDTWRQVSMNENGDRSKIQAINTTIHNEHRRSWQEKEDATATKGISKNQEIEQRHSLVKIGTQHKFSDAWKVSNINTPPTRDSRFFPNNKDVAVSEDQLTSLTRPESPSPPPPTQQGHPAYDGNVTHPHVSLPRPPAIVKLPPPKAVAPIGPPRPTSFAAVVATPAIPSTFPPSNIPPVYRNASRLQPRTSLIREINREESVAGNWQDKIDSLIGRKSSPNKTHSFAVDSASKKALEVPNQKKLANVLLPSRVSRISSDLVIDAGSTITKPASEVCFEEQEMGSLPPVKMPLKPPAAAWHLAPPPKPLPKRFLLVQSTSVEAITFSQQTTNNGLSLTINVPGQLESKNILIHINKPHKSSGKRSSTRFGTNQRHRWGQRGRS